MHDGGGWWMGLVWLIVLIALAAVAVWVVVTVLRNQSGHGVAGGSGHLRSGDPEQILAERLARGDIEPDEYRTRLQALREAHRL